MLCVCMFCDGVWLSVSDEEDERKAGAPTKWQTSFVLIVQYRTHTMQRTLSIAWTVSTQGKGPIFLLVLCLKVVRLARGRLGNIHWDKLISKTCLVNETGCVMWRGRHCGRILCKTRLFVLCVLFVNRLVCCIYYRILNGRSEKAIFELLAKVSCVEI